MVMGLRAVGTYADTNYNGFAPLNGGDTPTAVRAVNGKVISMILYAQVTQTGAIGDPSAGGTGWPVFSSTAGRVSSGPIGVKANVFGNFPDPSMVGLGSSPGNFVDLDGDGDIDEGNTDMNAGGPAGWITYHGVREPIDHVGPGSTDLNGNSLFGITPDGSPAQPIPIPGGFEYYLGEVDLVVTNAVALNDAAVSWAFRPLPGNANWYEHSVRTVTPTKFGVAVRYSGGTPGTNFSVGAPVLVVVPEPTCAGLAALASLALLPRRYNRPR